eukprot:gene8489-313_t
MVYSLIFWGSLPVWILMLFFPFLKVTHLVVKSNVINLLFALLQSILIISTFFITTDHKPGNSNILTLEGFQKNLENKYSALAFTSHYVGWDLFVASWIFLNSRRLKIPHIFIFISILLSSIFGTIGFLIYYFIRLILKREYQFWPTNQIVLNEENTNIFIEFEIKQNESFIKSLIQNIIYIWFGDLSFWSETFCLKNKEILKEEEEEDVNY